MFYKNLSASLRNDRSSTYMIFTVKWVHLKISHVWPSINLKNQENIIIFFQIVIKVKKLESYILL